MIPKIVGSFVYVPGGFWYPFYRLTSLGRSMLSLVDFDGTKPEEENQSHENHLSDLIGQLKCDD